MAFIPLFSYYCGMSGYRIYFNDKVFTISSHSSVNAGEDGQADGELRLLNPSKEDIKGGIATLDNNEVGSVLVLSGNLEETWEIFKQQFTVIQAGGGLVKNESDEYLFIFRRGKWDLPKGKLDDGETIAGCALREVNEETGLQNITLGSHLCNTYHVYHEKGKFILKESVWYHMTCASGQQLTPQAEEDILEVRWLAKDDWHSVLQNTFPSIKDVLAAAG